MEKGLVGEGFYCSFNIVGFSQRSFLVDRSYTALVFFSLLSFLVKMKVEKKHLINSIFT